MHCLCRHVVSIQTVDAFYVYHHALSAILSWLPDLFGRKAQTALITDWDGSTESMTFNCHCRKNGGLGRDEKFSLLYRLQCIYPFTKATKKALSVRSW